MFKSADKPNEDELINLSNRDMGQLIENQVISASDPLVGRWMEIHQEFVIS